MQVTRGQSRRHDGLRGRSRGEGKKAVCRLHGIADRRSVPVLTRLVCQEIQHRDAMSGSMNNATRLCHGGWWGDQDFPARQMSRSALAVDAVCFAQHHNQLLKSRALGPAVVAALDSLTLAYDHAYRYFVYSDTLIGILDQ